MKIDNVLKKCDTFKSSFCLLLMFMTLALGTQAVSNPVFLIVIIHSHQKGCKWINLIIISIISLVDTEKVLFYTNRKKSKNSNYVMFTITSILLF